jgi:hypothetical protein
LSRDGETKDFELFELTLSQRTIVDRVQDSTSVLQRTTLSTGRSASAKVKRREETR